MLTPYAASAATLVVLPVIPDRFYGPFGALNPHTLWRIVILMMAISAAGYIAVRTLGAGAGLPLAGFSSGFVSCAATIATLGSRAKQNPTLLGPAVAGAVLSTVATIAQLGILLAATSSETLSAVSIPLVMQVAPHWFMQRSLLSARSSRRRTRSPIPAKPST